MFVALAARVVSTSSVPRGESHSIRAMTHRVPLASIGPTGHAAPDERSPERKKERDHGDRRPGFPHPSTKARQPAIAVAGGPASDARGAGSDRQGGEDGGAALGARRMAAGR